jgi:hypothetical protein
MEEETMGNPFFHGNPVFPDQFVDRRRELRRIVGRIRTGQSTAIVSDPRSGKTSLLLYLSAPETRDSLYGADHGHLLFSYLDAQTLGAHFHQTQFWECALGPLREQVVLPNPDSSLAQVYALCRDNGFGAFVLERLLAQMAEANWRLVLILDEFDVLLHHPALHRAEFFGSLRSLASRSRGALALVIASRRSLDSLNKETQELNRTGSPYFNFLTEVILWPLPHAAVEELLQRSGGRFTPADHKVITQMAGGHPYLLQAAASALWEAYQDADQDREQRWQRAGEGFYDEAAQTMTEMWRLWTPATRAAFASVALAHANHVTGWRGHPDQDRYNIAAIRDLVRDAFTAKELWRFCQVRPSFERLLDSFGSDPALDDMIDGLIVHCQKRLLFPELLSEIQAYNPNQYQRYSSRLASPSLVGQIDFRPELGSLHMQGFIMEDESIPGGWRIRPQALLWWLGDQVAHATRSRGSLDGWLQAQEMDLLLGSGDMARTFEAGQVIADLFRSDLPALIEAVAEK